MSYNLNILKQKINELEHLKEWKQLKCYNDLLRLLCNERHKYAFFHHYAQSFMYKKVVVTFDAKTYQSKTEEKQFKLKGVKDILKQAFFPAYEYKREAYHYGTGAGSLLGGQERGKIVHNQICDYVNLRPSEFKAKHPVIHEYTQKAIMYLEESGIKPVIAEMIIYDEELGWGTAIDLIAVHKETEKIMIIDWKTGGDFYMNTGKFPLKGPLGKLYSDSPAVQAYLQVLMERILLKLKYDIDIKLNYVLQVRQDAVEPKSIPDDLVDNQDVVYEQFHEYLIEKRNSKGKKRKNNSSSSSTTEKPKSSKPNNKKKNKGDEFHAPVVKLSDIISGRVKILYDGELEVNPNINNKDGKEEEEMNIIDTTYQSRSYTRAMKAVNNKISNISIPPSPSKKNKAPSLTHHVVNPKDIITISDD